MGENPSIANGHDTWNRSRSRLSSSTSKQFAVEIFIQEDEGNLSPCLKYLYNVVSSTRGYEKILRKQVWRFVVIQHKRLSLEYNMRCLCVPSSADRLQKRSCLQPLGYQQFTKGDNSSFAGVTFIDSSELYLKNRVIPSALSYFLSRMEQSR